MTKKTVLILAVCLLLIIAAIAIWIWIPRPVTVDWSTTAYLFAADGTAETSFPITIKGKIKDKPDSELLAYAYLDIDLPKDFRYSFVTSDSGDPAWKGTELKQGNPNDLRVAAMPYDKETNSGATCYYFINTELGYFMAYWPNGDGSYLVAAADPNVTTEDVIAHFQPYCEVWGIANSETPSETQPTDPITTYIDWTIHGIWISSDGQIATDTTIPFTISGAVTQTQKKTDSLQLNITFPDTFPYSYEGITSFESGSRYYFELPYYVCASYAYHIDNRSVFSLFALCTEKQYAIFNWEDNSDRYLVASRNPNTDPQEILDYFQDFIAEYTTSSSEDAS